MPGLRKKNSDPSPNIRVQQELERRILLGMAGEWEAALLNLDLDERRLIQRPFFAIKDLKTQWGNWSQEKREISLSRQLVLNYPWDSIRDVLLHEMAHQIAQQMLGAFAQTSHGHAFKQACKMLRISSSASANYKPLQDRLLQGVSNPEDKLMLRIKKLLALAESKNRFEAEAAMAKAHELIAKYNVKLTQSDKHRQFISVFAGCPALRHPREDYHLANLLQNFYFVCGIWVPAYVISKAKMGRVLEISGSVQNIKIAQYVHDFICHYVDTQWLKYNQGKGLDRYRKTDFAVGIIEGFRDRLESNVMKKKTKSDFFAVINKADPNLDKYFKFKYPHTASVKKATHRQDAQVIRDGKKLGKKLVIAKGISERKTAKLRLIGQSGKVKRI